MFNPLDGEDNAKRKDCQECGQDSEVAKPNGWHRQDLDDELSNDVDDDDGEEGLAVASTVSSIEP